MSSTRSTRPPRWTDIENENVRTWPSLTRTAKLESRRPTRMTADDIVRENWCRDFRKLNLIWPINRTTGISFCIWVTFNHPWTCHKNLLPMKAVNVKNVPCEVLALHMAAKGTKDLRITLYLVHTNSVDSYSWYFS